MQLALPLPVLERGVTCGKKHRRSKGGGETAFLVKLAKEVKIYIAF